MCGVTVLKSLKGPAPTTEDIRRMSSAIRHRGPDGAGFARLGDGSLLFGHVRLSVVDPELGAQPMFNRDGSLCLTFNGEIYDYKTHRTHLTQCGHVFRTQGDSEVIIHAYTEYGLDFVHHLNGEFAFVLWDANEQRLIAVRDRFGVKPLFLAQREHEIAFASEAKGILALDRYRQGLSPSFLCGPLFGASTPHMTPFNGIEQVRPGQMVIINHHGEVTRRTWWQPKFEPNPAISFDEAREGVRERMVAAVRRRMVADVPIVSYLSGGLDSTIVAGLMAREQPGITSYTLSFLDETYDEGLAAAGTAEHFGTDLAVARCGADDLVEDLLSTLYAVESPLNNPNSVAKQRLSKRVRADQYKVCLTGEGADELFGGYAHFKLERIWRFMLAGDPRAESLWRTFQKVEHRTEGILWQKRMGWQQDSYAWGYPSYFRRSLEKAAPMVRWMLNQKPIEKLTQALDREFPPADMQSLAPFDASRKMALSVLSTYIIPTLGDRVEMTNSLECRTPFLDVDLAEYVFTLPPEYFIDDERMQEKHILRQAFMDLLPPRLHTEPKHPFMAPVWRDLHATRTGRELFEDLLSRRSLRDTGALSVHFIRFLRWAWLTLPRSSSIARLLDPVIGLMLTLQGVSRTLLENPIDTNADFEMEDRTLPT